MCVFIFYCYILRCRPFFMQAFFSHCCRAKSINNTWTWQKHVFSGSNRMHHHMCAGLCLAAGCRTMWNILSTLNYDDCWKGRIINTHGTICYRYFFLSFYFFFGITSQNGVDKLLYNRIDIAYKVRNKSATFFDNFFDCLFKFVFCLFVRGLIFCNF